MINISFLTTFLSVICFCFFQLFFLEQLRNSKFTINKTIETIIDFGFLTIFCFINSHLVYLFFILVALSIIDIKYYEIPSFSYAYVAIGVLFYLVASSHSILDYLIKALIVFCILFLLDLIFNLKVGGADLKLFIMLIPLIDVFNIVSFLYLVSFLAAITWFIKSILLKNKKWSLKEPIPLIPAISLALFLVL